MCCGMRGGPGGGADLLRCLLDILEGRELLVCRNDIRGQCVASFGVFVWVRSTRTAAGHKNTRAAPRGVHRVRKVGEAHEMEL